MPGQNVLDQFSLKGKVAIVTGGSRGIGLDVAKGYAEAGAHVAIWYNSTPAETLATKISHENGVKVKAYKCSLASVEEIEQVMMQVVNDFSKIDIVVVNAGVNVCSDALEFSEQDYRKIMSVNVDAAFFTAQAAGRYFRSSGVFGKLIFTASISGKMINTPQRQSVYNASKHAVVALAKSLAVEWVDFCQVNCISPGYIETDLISSQPKEILDAWTEQIPCKKILKSEDLKGIFVFLASDAAKYFVGGDIVVDGGLTLI